MGGGRPSTVKPLTPEQQGLVVRWMPLACRMANPWKRVAPWYSVELDGAAMLGLVKAASLFDPGMEVPFAAYMKKSVRSTVAEEFRMLKPAGYRRSKRDGVPSVGTLGERITVADHRYRGERDVDDRAQVQWLLSTANRQEAAALRAVYIDGMTQEAAAAVVPRRQSRLEHTGGLQRQRVHQICERWMNRVRRTVEAVAR